MAITRRQFVTRLGALAAAAGMSQAQVAKLSESFAYGNGWGNASLKPKVVWVHGAECTGCSTSVLGLFEDVNGEAIAGSGVTTATALSLVTDPDGIPRTFQDNGLNVDDVSGSFTQGAVTVNWSNDGADIVNIQDVLVDIIELDYHETVMNMGGDLAAQWLRDFADNNTHQFVLVVEGAVQPADQGGAWADDANNGVSWCSIGMSWDYDHAAPPAGSFENSMDEIVSTLACQSYCLAIVAIGQCATFGGYPGCKAPLASEDAGFDTSLAQSGAKGTYDFLYDLGGTGPTSPRECAAKVVNVPGCPTNPWWFTLTVVVLLLDLNQILQNGSTYLGVVQNDLSLNPDALDSTRRLKAVYPTAIHGPYCPRFNDWSIGNFAEAPGDDGCLQKIGCKGPSVKSLCGMHGWNAQQPENNTDWEYGLATTNPAAGGNRGGHCTAAGHPCMGCTEKGYPDSFVPFVTW